MTRSRRGGRRSVTVAVAGAGNTTMWDGTWGMGITRVVQLPLERAERSGTWPMNLVTSFHLIFLSMSESREHTIVTAQPREAGQ